MSRLTPFLLFLKSISASCGENPLSQLPENGIVLDWNDCLAATTFNKGHFCRIACAEGYTMKFEAPEPSNTRYTAASCKNDGQWRLYGVYTCKRESCPDPDQIPKGRFVRKNMYDNEDDTSAVQKWIFFFKPKINKRPASEKIDLNQGWTVILKLNQALTSGYFLGTNSDNWYANSNGDMISFTSKGYNKNAASSRYMKIDLFAYGIDPSIKVDVEKAWMIQGAMSDTGCYHPDIPAMDRVGTYLYADGTKYDVDSEVVLHNGGFRGAKQPLPQCTCDNGLAGEGCLSGEQNCVKCFSGYALDNGTCTAVAPECTCENGLAGDGCENGEELCVRCFSGYVLQNDTCEEVPPECTCQNGLAGDGCVNGEEICVRCFSGYTLENDVCTAIPPKCTCDNGLPYDVCLNGEEKCVRCFSGYVLENDACTVGPPMVEDFRRDDGSFQLKVNNVAGKWQNKCIQLQDHYRPGGYSPLTNQFEADLPAAVLTECDDNKQGQFFEYTSNFQLKSGNKCLTYASADENQSDRCMEFTDQSLGSQLYTVDCFLNGHPSQEWFLENGALRTKCNHGFSVAAEASIDDPNYAGLNEGMTVPLMLAGNDNQLDFESLNGLKAALEISAIDNQNIIHAIVASVKSSDIKEHGCYCSVLDGNLDYAGQGDPVDDIDALCMEWLEAVNTVKNATVCANDATIDYKVLYGYRSVCDLNTAGCGQDVCQQDKKFSKMLEAVYDDFSLVRASADVCYD